MYPEEMEHRKAERDGGRPRGWLEVKGARLMLVHLHKPSNGNNNSLQYCSTSSLPAAVTRTGAWSGIFNTEDAVSFFKINQTIKLLLKILQCKALEQWFSAFLILQPFSTVPHAVVTPMTNKIILFATS